MLQPVTTAYYTTPADQPCLVGSALQSYGVGALINATGTLSYKGAAYLGGLIFLVRLCACLTASYMWILTVQQATSAPTYLSQVFQEKRPIETVGYVF